MTTALVFDWGERRIGVAFANRLTGLAQPLTTIEAGDAEAADEHIDALVREWRPTMLVVGVPYNMDGTQSDETGKAAAFAARLNARTGLEVAGIDERLTSAEAAALLREQRRTGQRRRRIRRTDIDSMAAALIGESWLRET